jgi:ankyrin repeat protein
MFAAQGAPSQIVDLLLAAGANISINTRDRFGQTALMLACSPSNFYFKSEAQQLTIKALVAAGADVNAKDNQGMSPLGTAKANGDQELIKLLTGLNKP